ncbi:MAG: PEP-CTERM sorting domain-containing protein, partial [Pirellula sp.]
LYIPNSVFVAAGATSSTNVYLYYQYTNFNDGAEAWLLDKNFTYTNPEVPEPASMALWATSGLVGLVYRARRKASCSRSRNA